MIFYNGFKTYKNIFNFFFVMDKTDTFYKIIDKNNIISEPSCERIKKVHTSKNMISRGCEDWKDELEKGSLWLLLQ